MTRSRAVQVGLFLLSVLWLRPVVNVWAKDAEAATFGGMPLPFYIYHGFHSSDNHYTPSGWMGDYGDLRYDDHFIIPGSKDKHPVIRVAYGA